MNKKEITKAALKIFKHQRGLHDPQIIHPHREWLVGVGLACAVFLALSWWSFVTYQKHSDSSTIGVVTAADGTVVYREALVLDALTEFDNKAETLDVLTNNEPPEPSAFEIIPEETVATSSDPLSEDLEDSQEQESQPELEEEIEQNISPDTVSPSSETLEIE